MSWREIPIRAMYRRVEERGRPDLPLLSVYRDYGVVAREGREDNFNRPGEDLSTYKVVKPGDLVLNKMKTWQGSLGVASLAGIVSPAYFVARRVGAGDDRFIHHLLRSWALTAEYARRSKGIRPAQWDLPWDEFASIKVRMPSPEVQRAIADYLDAETARIDTLIEKKRRMVELLEERWSAFLTTAFAENEGIRVKHLLAAPLAYGVLVPEHDPDGVPMLRIMDLTDDGVDLSSVTRIPAALSAQYRRTVVSGGDLVVSVVGTLGRSLEITTELNGCNLNRPLARVRLKEGVPRSLIRLWFRSQQFQDLARQATSSDSAQPTLGLGDLAAFPVGIPRNTDDWSRMALRLEKARAPIVNAREALRRQLDLLAEHRQALITAAVTGELEIPGAAA